MAKPAPKSSPLAGLDPVSRRIVLAGGGALGAAVIGGAVALVVGNDDDGGQRLNQPANDPTPTPTESATTQPTTAASTPPAEPATPEPTKRAVNPVDPAEILEDVRISELRRYLDGGAFTVTDLVQACLDRIEEMDGGDIELGAVIETNPDALDIAAKLDAELAAGNSRGPMHGIPVLLKDIIATNDQMLTTAGSLALIDNTVTKDATLVTRLRDAGAVILGKTNPTEWSNFMGTGIDGFSARGGQTSNPYHLDYSPSGSSSGSAAAVAAGYVPLAVGAETNGSIMMPSSFCGVVGIKPTVGLVSRAGVLGISFTLDSLGPMGRTVEDVAIGLNALAAFDENDPAVTDGPDIFEGMSTERPEDVDYTAKLSPVALQGVRIGILQSMFNRFDPTIQQAIMNLVPLLEDAGASVVPDVFVSSERALMDTSKVPLTEFNWLTSQFFENYAPDGPVSSLQDIIDFNDENADEELANGREQSTLIAAAAAPGLDDAVYLETRAFNLNLLRAQGIDSTLAMDELDVLIAPTATPAHVIGGGSDAAASSDLAARSGYPAITMPVALINGLPIGMTFIGPAYSEQALLGYAYALEQKLGEFPRPTYIARGEALPGQ